MATDSSIQVNWIVAGHHNSRHVTIIEVSIKVIGVVFRLALCSLFALYSSHVNYGAIFKLLT